MGDNMKMDIKRDMMRWYGLSSSDSVECSCEHRNELWGFIEY
jgi:hypothetical protein